MSEGSQISVCLSLAFYYWEGIQLICQKRQNILLEEITKPGKIPQSTVGLFSGVEQLENLRLPPQGFSGMVISVDLRNALVNAVVLGNQIPDDVAHQFDKNFLVMKCQNRPPEPFGSWQRSCSAQK